MSAPFPGPGRAGGLAGWRRAIGADRLLLAGVVASVVWVALGLLAWWWLPPRGAEGGAAAGRGGGVVAAIAFLLPLGLIWLATFTARALAGLRDEAHSLRAQLLAMRAALPDTEGAAVPDDLPPPRSPLLPPPAAGGAVAGGGGRVVAPPARLAAARERGEGPQQSLDLGGPVAVEVAPVDLVRALNFPDGPDDRAAIAALRRALADGETARVIRAAQDIVTLLAGHGIYMDDVPAPQAMAATWRRFAGGERAAAVPEIALLAGDGREAAALADLLRADEVFRDAAHYFLRRWDRMLAREAPRLSDTDLDHLAATRSGRAFLILAEATGMFG